MSLGANQEQTPETQVAMHDAGSSSAMLPCQRGPFTTRSIYMEIPVLVEERHFNVSLFFFTC
jgi:hypothetical protein